MSTSDADMTPVSSRGALRAGDKVQITDPKGRLHTIVLSPGKIFHTHQGQLFHDELIGQPEGSVVHSAAGVPHQVLRPTLEDFTLSMPRGAAIIYPKDAALIVGMGDIYPGATVCEAGLGSGALTMALLRAVGTTGTVHSFELREDFATLAAHNIDDFFGQTPPHWSYTVGNIAEELPTQWAPESVDRIVLDMLNPWDVIPAITTSLRPGGMLICYVATVPQLSRTAEAVRNSGLYAEPTGVESLVRSWHLKNLAVRPEHRMIAHTGFLLFARRLASDTSPMVRHSRTQTGEPDEADTAAWFEPEMTAESLGQRTSSPKKMRRLTRDAGARRRVNNEQTENIVD